MPPPTVDVDDPLPPHTDAVVDPLPPHTAAHDDPVPPPECEAVADAELEAFGGGPVDFSLLSLYPDHIARHIWDIEVALVGLFIYFDVNFNF